MNTRSWLLFIFITILLAASLPGCGAPAVEPGVMLAAESAVSDIATAQLTAVVTATNTPPSPTAEIVYVVVTATADERTSAGSAEAEAPTATLVPTETPETVAEIVAAAPKPLPEGAEQAAVEMSLAAQKNITQHSPRPEPFVEPNSLEEITPYETWNNIEPNEAAIFHSYDGVRVVDGGQALLDLGGLMQLILRHDSEIQFVPGSLVQEELNRIAVDLDAENTLDKIVLAAHLLRGGFLGEKTVGGDPIALTTPNAVVVISGTEFFLAYDPETNVTWVGNFGGTMSVADIVQAEGEPLPDRQLAAIPAVRGRTYWPLHAHLTPDEFARLIELWESPIAAAELISGPYLRGSYDPEVAIRNGPGTEFSYVGVLSRGEYARIVGRGRGWWQIDCPPSVRSNACWVSGGAAYTDAYNLDIAPVPVTAQRPSPTPTPPPTATPRPDVDTTGSKESTEPVVKPPPDTSPGDVFDCRYVGKDRFEWYTEEGGPFAGPWQSGCPASPRIAIDGCTVSWDAGNSNVRSATIELSKIGSRAHGGARFEEQAEFAASLPGGSRGFDLPYGFGGEVTARFNVTLDNGDRHSKKAARTIRDECYAGPPVEDPPLKEEDPQPPYPPPRDSGPPPGDPYPPRVR